MPDEIEDIDLPVINNVILSSVTRTTQEELQDDFSKGIESFSGLEANLRKRKERLTKARRSRDGQAESKATDEQEVISSGYDLFEVVVPPLNLDALARLYLASPPHFAAVNAKVSNIVGLGYDLIDSDEMKLTLTGTTDDKKRARLVKKQQQHKMGVLKFLDNCNEEDEFVETIRKAYTDYETVGMGYIEVGRTDTGNIGYIGHIPAVSMRARRKRDGYVQIVNNKATFFKHFGTDTADPFGKGRPNEVIVLKKYNPNNSYYGVPDIVPALQAVTGNEMAGRYNLEYFENKAVPRYVLVVKGGTLGTQAQKNVLDFFENSMRGQGKSHRTLIIPLPADDRDRKTDFKMEPVEAGQQDASFSNYHKINVGAIFMAHRTPISKTSITDVSLAAARDADKTFKESVCRPEQIIVEKKLAKVFDEFGPSLLFKLTELTLTDEDTQSQIHERYIRMRAIVPNEVRAELGLAAREGGDEPVQLTGQQAAEARAQASGNRERDQQRTANSTDSASSTNTRNEQGAGRQQS